MGWPQGGCAPARRWLQAGDGEGASPHHPPDSPGPPLQSKHPWKPLVAAHRHRGGPDEAHRPPARARANLPHRPAANRSDFPSSGPDHRCPPPAPRDDSPLGGKMALIPVWHRRPRRPTDAHGEPSDPIAAQGDHPPGRDRGVLRALHHPGFPHPTFDPNPCREPFFSRSQGLDQGQIRIGRNPWVHLNEPRSTGHWQLIAPALISLAVG